MSFLTGIFYGALAVYLGGWYIGRWQGNFSFLLFVIIVTFTLIQRWVLRDRDAGRSGIRREKRARVRLEQDAAAARAGDPLAAKATGERR